VCPDKTGLFIASDRAWVDINCPVRGSFPDARIRGVENPFSDHATIGPSELWNGGTDHLRYLAQLPQYRFNLEKMIDVVASVNSFPSTTIK
jgi:hypothetical protein